MIPARSSAYRPDIDGLRALAVLLVVAFHAAPSRAPGGFIGVDVFFTISGYLITGIILRELDSSRFSLLRFYSRRCRRLVPALAVVLAATWVLGWFALSPDDFSALGRHLVAGATFTSNIVLWQETGYFDVAAELKPLLHLWSLGVEEHFYLFWPPLVVFAVKRRLSLAAITLLLAVASFSLNIWVVTDHPAATFYLLPTRFWELAIGAALAWLAVGATGPFGRRVARFVLGDTTRSRGEAVLRSATATLALLMIIGSAFVQPPSREYPGWLALVPTLATLLLIALGPVAWPSRRLLSNSVVVTLGLCSYPLYLWHWPLLSLAQIVDDGPPDRYVRLAIAAAAVPLAWLTWTLVERPIQARAFPLDSRRNMRVCLGVAVFALGLVVAIGWVTLESDGLDVGLRRHLALQRAASFETYRVRYPECAGPLEPAKSLYFCRTSRSGNPTAAVFGDSHADHLFPGLAAASSADGANWLLIGQPGCPPLSGVRIGKAGNTCAEATALALGLLSSSPSIETVLLASLGSFYFSEHAVPMAPLAAESSTSSQKDLFREGYSQTISLLERKGKSVALVIDVPGLSFMPNTCRPGPLFRRTIQEPCAVPRDTIDAREADYRDLIQQLVGRYPRLRVFDPRQYLCDARLCYVMRDGRLLYRDTNHLSLAGSEYLAGHLLSWLNIGAQESVRITK